MSTGVAPLSEPTRACLCVCVSGREREIKRAKIEWLKPGFRASHRERKSGPRRLEFISSTPRPGEGCASASLDFERYIYISVWNREKELGSFRAFSRWACVIKGIRERSKIEAVIIFDLSYVTFN